MLAFWTIKSHLIHQGDFAYMRVFHHNTDLPVDLVQPVFLLLLPALLRLSPLRFIEFLARIYRAGAHIDNFVNASERAASQFSFTNIDGELSGTQGLAGLCGGRVAFDPKHIKGRKSGAAALEKILHILVVFGFTCLMAGQVDFEAKLPNVDFDFPLPLFLFQALNPGEVGAALPFLLGRRN
jgi:hypothetical protein